ncbi:class I SAM-dependent methyltransferase [Bacillus taeanensis]|uniref:SAM-dependent methyltransferase n=1 Tax=Bacillus taeanensis TaxID=273032 RepID=A0A366Y0A4_9BACI|nr:methyltransferase [Bacillus taeanensis]RBW69591.1 SAM-dependent methyltransferase [Bacillus taeanensis]
MKEKTYDELLNINTRIHQKGFNNSSHYHRYEATPYEALETLFENYEVKSSDRVVDFGCGKGRLNFYIHYFYKASVVGVEMNEVFYNEAIENKNNYFKKVKHSKDDIQFCCCYVEEYQIDSLDNRFYFFNPFSVQIFMKVVNNILLSVEQAAREVEIILYYGSEDYVYFLENHPSFELKKEVILPGVYEQNPYEKFLIYCLIY